MNALRFGIIAAVLGAAVPFAHATKTRTWQQSEARHFAAGAMQQTVVSADGTLRLSRRFQPLANLQVSHVWALAADAHGFQYAATGSAGQLFKISPRGEISLVFQSKDSQVLSLAVTPQGTVFAGTGPGGTIVKITPEGEATTLVQTPESYIWALHWDADRRVLYAGTGPQGRIYSITPDGELALHYTTRQEHVLCLAMQNRHLIAGTGQRGVLYQITEEGKGSVLFETPQPEIKTLHVWNDAVYFGTSSAYRRSGAPRATAGSKNLVGQVDAGDDDVQAASTQRIPLDAKEPRPDREGKKIAALSLGASSLAQPGMATPGANEHSVYRLDAQGGVREIFRTKAIITCVTHQRDKLVVSTGTTGQVFELSEQDHDFMEIARVDESHVLGMSPHDEGWLISTGDPGKLYVLQSGYAASGTLQSEVFDTKAVSRFGSVRWHGRLEQGTQLSIAMRSGNVSTPDETWSEWTREHTSAVVGDAQIPPGRYLQYRVTLKSTDPERTPLLRGVEVAYQQINQAPAVASVEVSPPDLNGEKQRKAKIRWTATDPNEDELSYSISVRKTGWPQWIQIAKDLDKAEFEWDSLTLPSGNYQVRVTASDRKDNSEADALSTERCSAPVLLDQQAPEVTVKSVRLMGSRAVVLAEARDAHSNLVSAAMSVDGQKWISVFPKGDLFDGQAKQFEFATADLGEGTHVVMLRVVDAAGNVGVSDTVFEMRAKSSVVHARQ